jgi:glycerol kinase
MVTSPMRPRATHLVAIDQGTTSSRAIVFDRGGAVRALAQTEFRQIFPRPGWVEHDPEDLWQTTLAVTRRALADARLGAADVAAIGITNQRETTIIWDRATGKPIHNAIVWQDRRTADWCARMRSRIGDREVGRRTGLLFDPYFSASKIAWLLDNVAGARAAAARGTLAFGTVDTFLLWRLTGGALHATDATNAARTMLFNIRRQQWDDELLRAFRIPRAILPDVRDSAGEFGATSAQWFGQPIPVTGIAGDQQAATVGQACFKPGMIKSTFGTGCFVMLNTGPEPVRSKHRLLTTIAYRLAGEATYALEGSVFVSGAAIQWLRDQLGLIGTASESADLAASVADTGGVYFVPAFTGLGAPYWDPAARGAIVGLTRQSSRKDIVRAALESVVYQTRDLLTAMNADSAARGAAKARAIRVDGGLSANDWTMQFLADQLGVQIQRPSVTETTALGVAYLAGLGCGLFGSLDDIARAWQAERVFAPQMARRQRDALYAGWRDAVARTTGGKVKRRVRRS